MKILAVLFVLPWAVPSIPTIISVRFMLNPEWGVINQLIFKLTGDDVPNWLERPDLGAVAVDDRAHPRSLPFWTLILLAGRLAIPNELYEAASAGQAHAPGTASSTSPGTVDQHALRDLHSALDDLHGRRLHGVYLLTGGGPADLTHVLATLGIRYLRLDQVGMAMATIVCCLPLILPLVYFMMKRLSR